MIGWYVHDHGSGHRRRLEAVAAHLGTPVTGMGSGPPAAGVDWLPLPRDAGGDHQVDDPTAGGTLHWAPRGEPGLLGRAEAVSTWAREVGCRLLVVDVSVEMLLLGRLLGLPTVAVLQPGRRTDAAHRLGYASAAALLAPWPRAAQGRTSGDLAAATRWTGGFSQLDGRRPQPRGCDPASRCVVLALGRGGHQVRADDVRRAATATPGWHWHVAGRLVGDEPVGHPRVLEPGRLDDVWPLLSGADVVVGPSGGGLVGDVAAAGVPFVALPQPRPFEEQVHLSRLLRRLGVAEVATSWPAPRAWARLLERVSADPLRTAARWRLWSDGEGAARAADVVREVASRHPSSARPVSARRVMSASPAGAVDLTDTAGLSGSAGLVGGGVAT